MNTILAVMAIVALQACIGIGDAIEPGVDRFSVTYYGNGNNSGEVPSLQWVASGSSVVVEDPGALMRNSCIFDGWNTRPDMSGITYAAGDSVIVQDRLDLFARWIEVLRYDWHATRRIEDVPPLISDVVIVAGMIYAATEDGLMRSPDFGVTWEVLSGPELSNRYVRHLAVSGDALFFAAGDLYSSSDQGEMFSTVPMSVFAGSEYITALYADGDSLYVGTDTGLYISRDRGKSWVAPSASPHYPVAPVSAIYALGPLIWVGVGSGLVISADAGSNWLPIGAAEGIADTGDPVLGFAVDGDTLYAVNKTNLFASGDGGGSWSMRYSAPYGVYLSSVSAVDGVITLGTQCGGLFVSNDEGVTWHQNTIAPDVESIRVSCVARADALLCAGTYDGLYVSVDNGVSWIHRATNNGIPGSFVEKVKGDDGMICVSTSASRIGVSFDEGKTWVTRYFSPGSGPTVASVVYAGGSVIAVVQASRLILSNDSGVTWSYFDLDDSGINPRITLLSGGTWYAATYSTGMAVSVDNGATWGRIGNIERIKDRQVLDIAVAGQFQYILTGDGLHISSDSGVTWRTVEYHESGFFSQWNSSGNIAVSDNGQTIAIAMSKNVIVSRDGGNTWGKAYFSGSYEHEVILVGNRIILANDNGIEESSDYGNTWVKSAVHSSVSGAVYDLMQAGTVLYAAHGTKGLMRYREVR